MRCSPANVTPLAIDTVRVETAPSSITEGDAETLNAAASSSVTAVSAVAAVPTR